MIKITFESIVKYAQQKLGDRESPAKLAEAWIRSAIDRWAHSGSITSFAPFEALLSRDLPFEDLLLDLLSSLVNEGEFDGFSATETVCSALSGSLEVLLDENHTWASGKTKDNENDFAEAAQLTATVLAVFRALQHFNSERAMQWGNDVLRSGATSNGFLGFGTSPFAISMFAVIPRKSAKSEARSNFFVALYEWAEKNSTGTQVIARFPQLLLLRLEAVHGAQIDLQMFDVLRSVFTNKGAENLQPIQVIDLSIADKIRAFDNESILTDFSTDLSDLASVHVSRYIREMDEPEKLEWLKSPVLRSAFFKSLNTPPIPEYAPVVSEPPGSSMDIILGGVCHAT